eukprot:TRINITY_DN10991_c0_g1_i1.p1 TRINITY_DN10991_c0_g1~~TRINITY_DN10991_c0_g1_i1.p1  ORF type:complete len:1210 (+),score=234.21 TRINITY_DN10991_c0_g1_i1:50-3679(+)
MQNSAESRYSFEYYSARPPYWSYDGIPFGSAYGVTLAVVVSIVAQKGAIALEHLLLFLVPAILHVLLFLATQWFVEANCSVRYNREKDVEKATHVKVKRVLVPGSSHQSEQAQLVPLLRQDSEVSLSYLKKKFIFDQETRRFERLRFDIESPLKRYFDSQGLSGKQVEEATKRYGQNVYDIPLPTFSELFKEAAVAPFFVFQLVCVLLWLMDEYWYYALLTLFMLIMLEAQMVQKRRGDLSELRAMRIPPRPMQVFRDGSWKMVQSHDLLPGDIIGISRKAEASFPCDALLLQGNVLVNEAMLTGESVPQMKVCASMPKDSEGDGEALSMTGLHKQHIVSAGTNIMLHQNTGKAKGNFKKVPMVGSSPAAVGYVLRTGFDTTQGKLCRTILFSAERVTVSSREALYFLMILLAFAVVACVYVLYDGLVLAPTRIDEPPRSTFKLLLAVSHIITAVVPPEFPIMLSLAVNLSLVVLVQKRIFCTEPFRVPLAGRVQTCCFDKTGTLTSDSMEVGGVHGLEEGFEAPQAGPALETEQDTAQTKAALGQKLPFMTTAVMAACSGLTVIEGDVVGDPLEKAALQAVKWLMIGPDLVTSKPVKGSDRIQVLRRYPFASELQRMSVLVRHQGPSLGHLEPVPEGGRKDVDRVLALVKGSCEALRPRLAAVPENLDTLQEELTRAGFRVLCLGARELKDKADKFDADAMERDEVEKELQFAGLLVLKNSVKPNTTSTIKQLRRSYHRTVMITGDHPMTACQVATNVSLGDGRCLILESLEETSGNSSSSSSNGQNKPLALEWRSYEDKSQQPRPFATGEALTKLAKSHTLCVPGKSLESLSKEEVVELVQVTTVWARVSPQQKEQVVIALNQHSHTMMVGDGTNDVGALKHAHVGVSLLSGVEAPHGSPASRAQREAQAQAALAGDQAPLVQLGDASIASPFTYKGDSVKCGLYILRHGRATLCTVLMMYKIMGINSVMSAFAMSALTLDGVKLGDSQTAAESLFSSMCFFLVSRSAPAKQLAKQHPISSVFDWSVLTALALQLVVHLSVLFYGWQMANEHRVKDFKRDLEGEFAPNLTNSVVFLLMAAMHASSFLANYEGHPFMQPLSANKALTYSLILFVTLIFACASEAIPELNESLSLVLSPNEEFRQKMMMLVVADISLSVLLSRGISFLAVHLRKEAAERHAKERGLGMGNNEESERKKSSGKKSKSKSS